MSTLVLAEHDNRQLKGATLNTITVRRQGGRAREGRESSQDRR
jgi:hypothetical protein